MNKKININPSSTKWLEKDDRVVADYFCDLGFRSLKQILDMRVFDLMNMQGLNAVRVEEVIICLYKWLNPNTAIDEAIYNGMMSQPFLYTPWRKEHKDLAAIKVGDLVLTPGINMKAIQHFYDAIRKAFFKSEEYNWRWYKFRNMSMRAKSACGLQWSFPICPDTSRTCWSRLWSMQTVRRPMRRLFGYGHSLRMEPSGLMLLRTL